MKQERPLKCGLLRPEQSFTLMHERRRRRQRQRQQQRRRWRGQSGARVSVCLSFGQPRFESVHLRVGWHWDPFITRSGRREKMSSRWTECRWVCVKAASLFTCVKLTFGADRPRCAEQIAKDRVRLMPAKAWVAWRRAENEKMGRSKKEEKENFEETFSSCHPRSQLLLLWLPLSIVTPSFLLFYRALSPIPSLKSCCPPLLYRLLTLPSPSQTYFILQTWSSAAQGLTDESHSIMALFQNLSHLLILKFDTRLWLTKLNITRERERLGSFFPLLLLSLSSL